MLVEHGLAPVCASYISCVDGRIAVEADLQRSCCRSTAERTCSDAFKFSVGSGASTASRDVPPIGRQGQGLKAHRYGQVYRQVRSLRCLRVDCLKRVSPAARSPTSGDTSRRWSKASSPLSGSSYWSISVQFPLNQATASPLNAAT